MKGFDRLDKDIKNGYVKQGVMIFSVGLLLMMTYFAINNFDVIRKGLAEINDILMPFYIGIVMAYLLTPIFNICTKKLYKLLKDAVKLPPKRLKASKVISTVVCIVFLLAILTGLVVAVVPGTVESVMTLIPSIEPAVEEVSDFVQRHLEENPELAELVAGRMDDLGDNFIHIVTNKLLPATETILTGAYAAATGTIGTLIDLLVALILCIYILNSKEVFAAQARKWVLAFARPEKAESWFELAELTNITFGGFINGKIIDSFIIGILCAVLMTIFKMPMVALISVIVGVTNIIPFFGPFIGAIPSVLLIMIVDPIKALEFAILVLALQQFDGNILGPKILGKALNLSSFWVMFAIIVAGGLFGFLGMILGVPLFAILYTYISRAVNGRLRKKSHETDQIFYEDYSKYGIDKEELYGMKISDSEKTDNTDNNEP